MQRVRINKAWKRDGEDGETETPGWLKKQMGPKHTYGAGAAACAVCCAAPLLTLLGVAGAAATAVTFVFAGLVFATVVALGAGFAVWNQRRRRRATASGCAPVAGPMDIEISPSRPADQ